MLRFAFCVRIRDPSYYFTSGLNDRIVECLDFFSDIHLFIGSARACAYEAINKNCEVTLCSCIFIFFRSIPLLLRIP